MTILYLVQCDETQKKHLQKRFSSCSFIFTNRKEVTKEQLAQAQVIIGNPSVEQCQQATQLAWLQLESAGADRYVKEGVLAPEVVITNATGAYGEAIAEYMVGYVFGIAKRNREYLANQQAHCWKNQGSVACVKDLKILSVGMGDIGTAFAQKMHALGCSVVGVRRTIHDCPSFVDHLETLTSMDTILPQQDVVALSLPSTPETDGTFDEQRLRLLKKDSILINVGRGKAIVTSDLVKLLEEGWFKGVVLDVVDPEPLPEDHPLWDFPQVYLTPHVSGNYNMQETFAKVQGFIETNLECYLLGKPLINLVDRAIGYKSH